MFSPAHLLALRITAIISGILYVLVLGIYFFGSRQMDDTITDMFARRDTIDSTVYTWNIQQLDNNIPQNISVPIRDKKPWKIRDIFGRGLHTQSRIVYDISTGIVRIYGELELATDDIDRDILLALPVDTVVRVTIYGERYALFRTRARPNIEILYEPLRLVDQAYTHILWYILLVLGTFSSLLYIVAYRIARATIDPIDRAHSASLAYSRYIAHEIRTPLSIIQSDIEVHRLDMPHTLSTISDLSILTDTLLLLGTDPLSLPKNDIDVYTLVRNIYTKMQHIHTREDIHLDIPTDIPHVHGHISLVSILYRNILENALKYALPGAISIVYADGIYSIKNNATYISPQDIEYIWEDGNTYGGKWNGIGLSLVRGIVDVHGWDISARYIDGQFVVYISV